MKILLLVVALLFGLVPPAVADPGPSDWRIDLTRPVSVSNVSVMDGRVRLARDAARELSAQAHDSLGMAVYEPDRLREPANSFTASVEGTGVEVDVRGREPDGDWTEWTPEPAVLAAPTSVVQVRVVLSGPAAELRRLAVAPSTAPPARTEIGFTYQLYATREGLVGGRTANGHIIVERDHFVALPSRRGLSAKDTGDYTVKVCAANGRCEWAPVWDVGPWNTKDDYWNHDRQMWMDLPQGRPQAQAAKQDGHNGGRDQFGRVVRNPAGIDLADGTFWDGLGLTTNSWVTVTFTWTGSGPAGYVSAGEPLNVRSGPSTDAPIVGLAADLARIRVECQSAGETVHGSQGETDAWLRLAPDMWVTAAYVSGVTGVPTC